jgi:hypothetical protein
MLHHISVHISKSTISKPIIRKIISWAVQHISRIIPDGVEEAAVVWRDHSPHNNTFHFSPTQLGSVLRITETAKEDSEPRSARMGSCILASARSQPTHFTPCKKRTFFTRDKCAQITETESVTQAVRALKIFASNKIRWQWYVDGRSQSIIHPLTNNRQPIPQRNQSYQMASKAW